MKTFKLKALSAVVAVGMMAAAGAASAQTVNGAGATLPQPLYEEIFGITPGSTKMVQGTWTYAGGGSGSGKSRFLTTTNTVNFAGSDSALVGGVGSELETYNNNRRSEWGALIQIPAFLTSVTLPYKLPSGATAPDLNLSREQVCKVFSGQVTTWGDLLNNANSTAIKIAYRSEKSGTTELLSQFLDAACDSHLPAGKSFTVSNSFTTVVASALATGIPSNWVAVTGSGGVRDQVDNNPGTLSYLSPDYSFKPDEADRVAKIDGVLPSTVSFPSGVTPPSPVGSARSNPLNWVPAYSLPSSGYPIYGTTNLLVGQCYDGGFGPGTEGAAIKDFVTKLNNGSYDALINKHYFVKLPANWNSAIKQEFLDGNATRKLEFGNTNSCNGVGRPS